MGTEVDTYDLVHSTSLLFKSLENLKHACQSFSLKAVGECTIMTRIAVTEVVSVYSAVACNSEDEITKQE